MRSLRHSKEMTTFAARMLLMSFVYNDTSSFERHFFRPGLVPATRGIFCLVYSRLSIDCVSSLSVLMLSESGLNPLLYALARLIDLCMDLANFWSAEI